MAYSDDEFEQSQPAAAAAKPQAKNGDLSALLSAAAQVQTDAAADAEKSLQKAAVAVTTEVKQQLATAVASVEVATDKALNEAVQAVDTAAAAESVPTEAKKHHHHRPKRPSSKRPQTAAEMQAAEKQRLREAVLSRRARRRPHIDLSGYDRSDGSQESLPSLQRCIARGDAHAVAAVLSQLDEDAALSAISAKDAHGWNSLHWAASTGDADIVALILR